MISPPRLKKGSVIRIVSPAGKIEEKHVLPAVQWLEKRGYHVKTGKNIFARHFQFAGSDNERLNDLQEALDDTNCDVIICSRGGYGTVRIIDQLNLSNFLEHPKWLVGFSDITALHCFLNKYEAPSIHGVMPRFFLDETNQATESLASLINMLEGKNIDYQLPFSEFNRFGKTRAELVGGNLSLITSLIGTSYDLDTDGKILFLEDIDEYLYQTDRMFHQLKLSGKLEKLAGLILGDFTDMKDNSSPFGKSVLEIAAEAVSDYTYPICCNFPAGHDKTNLALLFGKAWELDVNDDKTRLSLQQQT